MTIDIRSRRYRFNRNYCLSKSSKGFFIYIESANGLNIEKITIFDLSGKILKDLYTNFEKIDFKSFPAGVYYLKIQSSKGVVVKKILKN
ncbi:MAG: T9SS type A sorting domain-containing protein [Confluentibacter sp.]|nr:T9SS type A sorting domain-containing protein [Confluentibacter sp.]